MKLAHPKSRATERAPKGRISMVGPNDAQGNNDPLLTANLQNERRRQRKRSSKDNAGAKRAHLKVKAARSPRYAKKLRSQGKMTEGGAIV